jgi:hypothetical protein
MEFVNSFLYDDNNPSIIVGDLFVMIREPIAYCLSFNCPSLTCFQFERQAVYYE